MCIRTCFKQYKPEKSQRNGSFVGFSNHILIFSLTTFTGWLFILVERTRFIFEVGLEFTQIGFEKNWRIYYLIF